MNQPPSGIAVVTGGASGIGLSVTDRLLEQGWRVAFFSQNGEQTIAARNELVKRHETNRILARAADQRDPAAIEGFFDEVRAMWGSPTALVCNAGISPKSATGRTPFAEISLDDWNDVLRVNLTGAFVCVQCALSGMQEVGQGRIVLIGSVAARTTPRVAGAAYVASKAGLAGLAHSIVAEYSRYGITANVVAPGRILTDMTGDPESEPNRAALKRIPVARLGVPNDIARVVAFLVEAQSTFINGAIIDVNGGEYCPD